MIDRTGLLTSVSRFAIFALAGWALTGAMTGAVRADDHWRMGSVPGTLPAVSGLNAKVGGYGGKFDDDSAAGAFLSLSMPLGHSFGLQVDGLVGSSGGDRFYGVGGHLFWRDPSRGLLGLYASHVQWDADPIIGGFQASGADVGKVGAEAHIYLNRISLEGIGAYQFGTETGFAGKGRIALYLHDDLRIHAGVSYLEGPGATSFAGVEWMAAPQTGLSLFAEAGHNDDIGTHALGGVKLYLAPGSKSLIRRHREDDPDIELPSDLFMTIKGPCPVGQTLINGFCDGNT